MSALSLRGITKAFGGNQILDGVSLDVAADEFIALVGPSGCGKSTLLRVLAGLDHADQGEILIGGQDMSGVAAADRNIAMVFQSYALYPHLTASENIAVPLAMRRLSRMQRLPFIGSLMPGQRATRRAIARDVRDMATSLKIDHLLDRKPGQMSGGQRQRVALARAMVRQPSIFLMDEPLSNLDANLRVHARGEIVDLHRRAGVPTLYVTHDQAEALSMADRVAVMMGGKLLQIASPEVIYDDPAHIEVARFIGQPRINLLPAFAEGGVVLCGGLRLTLENLPDRKMPVTIAIRPEFVFLSKSRHDGLAARIERVEFLGSEVILHCRLEAIGETIVVKVQPAEASGLVAGDPVGLRLSPGRTLIFAEDGSRLPGGVATGDAGLGAADAGLASSDAGLANSDAQRERAHG
ncbi:MULTISPECIES: ABC transporter ATP-binding protein [Rhizobium]|uniref:ABC transporter ATP-binding protein n=1 Tax=Rhizobium TaxID=379 RepID=UPI00052304C8|nr:MULTISPECIES: ABC transporter ATP-binding protein [Rhizobium]KPN24747.1 glycerol-3-phosphate ABC transporter ATP-binding protein [Rhizobium brockwellii]MDV4154658.1 ABC transporter ATP-binding protein [Rhizobium brockwellii]QJX05257.1 ABC transporter ATP-binding protein [Rhizobium brockwellii]TAX39372.1 ABC transporter ATP-binding protein [Rhizobium leguminosarum]TAX92230.1 ABC transporter ATP-binding protein [Rhizobium leguminosarum]